MKTVVIVPHAPSCFGTRDALIVGGIAFLIASHMLLGDSIVNIDFGVGTESKKEGPAAVGNGPTDFWNHYTRDDGSGGFLESGGVAELVPADGSPTGVGLTVNNALGLWIAGHSDPMLDSYLYPLAGGDILITVTNLAGGKYDLYFYVHGLLDGESGDIQVHVGDVDYGLKATRVTADWQSLQLQEGIQYVRFQELSVPAEVPLVITVRPGTTGLAVMNGMQLLRQSDCSPPSGLATWWPGEGDGTDVAGGNDGELVNGLGFAEGLVGQPFEFTASGQHVLIPASEELAVDSLTIEAWIKPASVDLDTPVVEYAPDNAGVGVHLWVSVHPEGYQSLPGSLFANVVSADGVSHIISTEGGNVQPGVWSHVAVNCDMTSGLSRLFHNGTQVAEGLMGSFLPKTALPVLLGHRMPGNAGTFDGFTFAGQMDEVSIYSRALSLAEIAAIHAAGSNGKCVPQGYFLTVETTPGGTVLRDPDVAAYQPGDTVTPTALPEAGFVFDHWQGDVAGTEPEVRLLMDGPKQVMAVFVEVAPPVIAILSPLAGVTEFSAFVFIGTVTDNLGVGSAR